MLSGNTQTWNVLNRVTISSQDGQKVASEATASESRGVRAWYVEALSDAGTKLADFFSILVKDEVVLP